MGAARPGVGVEEKKEEEKKDDVVQEKKEGKKSKPAKVLTPQEIAEKEDKMLSGALIARGYALEQEQMKRQRQADARAELRGLPIGREAQITNAMREGRVQGLPKQIRGTALRIEELSQEYKIQSPTQLYEFDKTQTATRLKEMHETVSKFALDPEVKNEEAKRELAKLAEQLTVVSQHSQTLANSTVEGNADKYKETKKGLEQELDKANVLLKSAMDKDVSLKEKLKEQAEQLKKENMLSQQREELDRFVTSQRELHYGQLHHLLNKRDRPNIAENVARFRNESDREEPASSHQAYLELGTAKNLKALKPGTYVSDDPKWAFKVREDKEGNRWAHPHPPIDPKNEKQFKERYGAIVDRMNPGAKNAPIWVGPIESVQLEANQLGPDDVMKWAHWYLDMAKERGRELNIDGMIHYLESRVNADEKRWLESVRKHLPFGDYNLTMAEVQMLKAAVSQHNQEVKAIVQDEEKEILNQIKVEDEAKRLEAKGKDELQAAGDRNFNPNNRQQHLEQGLDSEIKDFEAQVHNANAAKQELDAKVQEIKEFEVKGEAKPDELKKALEDLEEKAKAQMKQLSGLGEKHALLSGVADREGGIADIKKADAQGRLAGIKPEVDELMKVMQEANFDKQLAEAKEARLGEERRVNQKALTSMTPRILRLVPQLSMARSIQWRSY